MISIHAPREGSDPRGVTGAMGIGISIHAPREGSDTGTVGADNRHIISIHAPREGSDFFAVGSLLDITNFNPRSPRGERPSLQR